MEVYSKFILKNHLVWTINFIFKRTHPRFIQVGNMIYDNVVIYNNLLIYITHVDRDFVSLY